MVLLWMLGKNLKFSKYYDKWGVGVYELFGFTSCDDAPHANRLDD